MYTCWHYINSMECFVVFFSSNFPSWRRNLYALQMSSKQKKFLVRLARQEDKQALEELVGRTLHSPLNDTLIAMEFERGPILGALSYSK